MKSRLPEKSAGTELQNGELIRHAEETGYELLVTTGKNIRHQQNLKGRAIAILVIGNQQWPDVKLNIERILAAVVAATPGSYTEVEIPHRQ